MVGVVKKLIVPVLVLGVAGGGYAVVKGKGPAKKKEEVTYETGAVARGDVRSFVTATGTIQPWKTVEIKSNVGGRIDRLYVDLGATVKAGQPIMDIDPTDTYTAYEQANADLQAAEARVQQATVNWEQEKLQTVARVASAEKAVKSAEARLAQTKAQMEAQPELTNLSIAQAKASLASAEKAHLQAVANRKQLQEQLSQLKEVTIPLNIETVAASVEQAKANVLQATNEYKRQRQLLAQGYVAKSDVEGAYARLATQQATLRTAQQRKETLERENQISLLQMASRLDEARSRVDETDARVEQARAGLKVAQTNEFQNNVTAQQYESALAGLDQAKADLATARAAMKQVDVRRNEILAAKTQIVRSSASKTQAKQNLGFTKIVAPSDGIVIGKLVEQGTIVPSSRASIGATTGLITLGDISKQWVVCSVDETDIGQVSENQKVTVRVDAYPSMLLDGKVVRIDPQAKIEQNVVMIPVTVEISTPDPRFKAGMNAECEFIVDEVTDVLTVPNEALKESEGVYKVQKMGPSGTPVEVEVEVGLAGQDTTEIRSGLKEGDTVVTKTVVPEKPQTNNPFGGPFGGGGGPRRSGGGPGGGSSGGGGGGGGGGRR